ncbi:transglutaminase domain-containing protein [bacterium]|nr:transglutaminase domain-containing protein [bacterium]
MHLAAAFLFVLLLSEVHAESGALVLEHPAVYQVEFGFTITSASPLPERVEAWLPYPVDRAGQKVGRIRTSLPPTHHTREPACFYWRIDHPAVSPISASQSFELTVWEKRLDHSRYRARSYNTRSGEYRRYTASSPHIDLSDPWVVGQAETLRVKYSDPLDRARAAYDLVCDHLDYVRIYGFGGSRYAAREGHGECGDYSCLFAALCRKSGIPARPVVGYWATELDEAHVWAEFFLEGVGWIPCDPSQGDLVDRDRFFARLDNMRVSLNHDVDISLPYGTDVKVAPIFQTGVYWIKGGTNVKITPILRAERK